MDQCGDDFTNQRQWNLPCDLYAANLARENEMNGAITNLFVLLKRLDEWSHLRAIQRRQIADTTNCGFHFFRVRPAHSPQGCADARGRDHSISDSFTVLQTPEVRSR